MMFPICDFDYRKIGLCNKKNTKPKKKTIASKFEMWKKTVIKVLKYKKDKSTGS